MGKLKQKVMKNFGISDNSCMFTMFYAKSAKVNYVVLLTSAGNIPKRTGMLHALPGYSWEYQTHKDT